MQDSNFTSEHPFVAVEFDTLYNDWDPPCDRVGIELILWSLLSPQSGIVSKMGRKCEAEIS